MKKSLLTVLTVAVLFISFAHAQTKNTDLLKVLSAQRTQNSFKIDGELNEGDWMQAPIATDFVQNQPNPGINPTQKSEVKVLYDNTAIYVSAVLYDESPKEIPQELSQRDNLGNTDWFGIFLNPYGDGINGVSFILTPAGVQFDAQYSVFGEDEGWDAVWQGEAKITEKGWVVEFKIPYSAIRFPDVEEQNWKVNFGRMIRNKGEKNFWSHIDPNQAGFLNQFGSLEGISNIKSPVRLSATPFVATYLENYNDKAEVDPQNVWGRSFTAGMDIKYGLSDAFTLDMTLIPDFGEAQSDNNVLNLTQFEVQFDENRQFFTEGTELFNKGGLFYSRRIGGNPLNQWAVYDDLEDGEEVTDNPAMTQLYNATKVSGRNPNGTGLGFFNAVAGETYATIKSSDGNERKYKTNPLTNYNVMVLDQNLKNNSFFTILNTNVWRDGSDYDANVTGGVFQFRNEKQSYQIRGNLAVSQLYFANHQSLMNKAQSYWQLGDERIEEVSGDMNKTTLLGHKYNIGISKVSGNFQFWMGYSEESDTYDHNDLGFLYSNNERDLGLEFNYSHYKPFGIFNAMGGGGYTGAEFLYNPTKFTEYGVNLWWWAQTKKFWHFNIWTYFQPVDEFDYFEPRTPGRFFVRPEIFNIGLNINSDSRKKLQFGFNTNVGNANEKDWYWYGISGRVRYRVNDKLNFSFRTNNFKDLNDVGFVTTLDEDNIILGRRDQKTTTNTFNAAYNFSSTMALTFRLRHYWSAVEYRKFNLLGEDGYLQETDYNEFNDQSFTAFNIDMIYRWRFAPGSDIFLIWKNSISDFSTDQSFIQYEYGRSVERIREFPQSNSLSLKVIYFLDYLSLVKNQHPKD